MAAETSVHSSAVIAAGAELDEGVEVGPFTVIGPFVRIGARTRIGSHSAIDGHTTLGTDNVVFQFTSIGAPPQDLKYGGEPTKLTLGHRNTIREFVTLNRGTAQGRGCTEIGNDNLFMAYAHVAHDCIIGSGVVMANGATLAGHVTIEDTAIVGGLVAIHQFVRIGQLAMLAGGAMVSLDVPPFCMAAGDRAKLHGLNAVGLRRNGLTDVKMKALRSAYRLIFQSSMLLKDALCAVRSEHGDVEEVRRLVEFIESSNRGVCR